VTPTPIDATYFADNDIIRSDMFVTCSTSVYCGLDTVPGNPDIHNPAITVQTSFNSPEVAAMKDPLTGKAYGPDNYVGFKDLFFKVEFPPDGAAVTDKTQCHIVVSVTASQW